jgi:hypothetical protein
MSLSLYPTDLCIPVLTDALMNVNAHDGLSQALRKLQA